MSYERCKPALSRHLPGAAAQAIPMFGVAQSARQRGGQSGGGGGMGAGQLAIDARAQPIRDAAHREPDRRYAVAGGFNAGHAERFCPKAGYRK